MNSEKTAVAEVEAESGRARSEALERIGERYRQEQIAAANRLIEAVSAQLGIGLELVEERVQIRRRVAAAEFEREIASAQLRWDTDRPRLYRFSREYGALTRQRLIYRRAWQRWIDADQNRLGEEIDKLLDRGQSASLKLASELLELLLANEGRLTAKQLRRAGFADEAAPLASLLSSWSWSRTEPG